jgi:nucleotidyltransferase substrate binding protein (TIGR01987 family)
MSNTDEIRRRQRLENFEKAFLLLQDVLEGKPIDEYSRLEQEGIIHRYEYTFELAWKTIKDKLFYEGCDENAAREALKAIRDYYYSVTKLVYQVRKAEINRT